MALGLSRARQSWSGALAFFNFCFLFSGRRGHKWRPRFVNGLLFLPDSSNGGSEGRVL